MNYWYEATWEALNSVGVELTHEQVSTIAGCMESAHENYGMAMGHDCIPNPHVEAIKKLESKLKEEMDKVTCVDCGGTGRNVDHYGTRSSNRECHFCRGQGRRKR